MPTPPAFHLVCGATGAGKTTHALRLARERRAVPFSIDDWMVRLFAPDMPGPPDWNWIGERAARCEEQIVATALALGQTGGSSILDLGLLRAERRQALAARATAAGLGVELHFIDVGPAERWRRISARNNEKGETYRLTVTRPMFDFIETIWQPPDAREMVALNGTRVTQS